VNPRRAPTPPPLSTDTSDNPADPIAPAASRPASAASSDAVPSAPSAPPRSATPDSVVPAFSAPSAQASMSGAAPPPVVAASTVPECRGDMCITCADTAVAVRIREVKTGGLAVVDTEAGPEEISIALVEAAPGDVVLVHAKEAIAVVESGQAPRTVQSEARRQARGEDLGEHRAPVRNPSGTRPDRDIRDEDRVEIDDR